MQRPKHSTSSAKPRLIRYSVVHVAAGIPVGVWLFQILAGATSKAKEVVLGGEFDPGEDTVQVFDHKAMSSGEALLTNGTLDHWIAERKQ